VFRLLSVGLRGREVCSVSAGLTVRGRLHRISQADTGQRLGGRGRICAALRVELGGTGLTMVPQHARRALGKHVVGLGLQGFCSRVTGTVGSSNAALPAFTLQLDRTTNCLLTAGSFLQIWPGNIFHISNNTTF